MPQITDIKPQKRKKRFNIYVDGKFSFAVSAEALAKAELKIDQEISDQKIEELIKEDDFVKVYDRVLKFFSYRPRSEKELKDWFKKKQVGEETQKLIYQKLKNLGYLNDEEFARWWIEQRTTFRPASSRLLALELRQKGISREIIDKQLSNLAIKQFSEIELAKKVAEKKLKSLRHYSYLEQRQKLVSALARRGFSWEVIKEVIDEKLGEEYNSF
ncbi:MAG: RecX family transcriptional regulator [Patescibacteria group bacterium]